MNQLLKKVEDTRKLMIQSGLQYGLLDTKTILLSERLDELLNLYSNKYGVEENDFLIPDDFLQ